MPSSSIIIPVFNRAALTRQCLNALLNHPYAGGRPEIIVVDDASTDLTPRLLAGYGDTIQVIRHDTNGGFAKSCNAGAAAATGDYLVFLNNDMLPQAGWLEALVRYAQAHPAAAAVGSKLLFPNDTIQHAGVVICQDHFPRHVYAGFPADHPAVNQSRRFPVVTGACMLLPRARFFEANGFDTVFLNGFEDVDLCLRLGERGYEIHYCHESVLYHFESATRVHGGGEGGEVGRNTRLYAERWSARVHPDEFDYYFADGLLKVTYVHEHPYIFEISPYLATQLPADDLSLERLLNYRTNQVSELLRELAARPWQSPFDVLSESLAVPSPAGGLPPAREAPPAGEPDADLMHPEARRLVGPGDPWRIGREYLWAMVDLGGLQPHERVLEVGCGVGRMALPLARYLDAAGSYTGFDIVAASIEWARAKITPRYPNFVFQHADIANTAYNPHGRHSAAGYRFPYPDASFDFVFLTSVFTHMLPAGMENYVAEIARVLKPGGRSLITFFLLDDAHRRNLADGLAFARFDFDHGLYRTLSNTVPEAAVAYDVDYIRDLFARHGLPVREPPHLGNWSDLQSDPYIVQDIVVSVRLPLASPARVPVTLPLDGVVPQAVTLSAPAFAAQAGARLLAQGRPHTLSHGPGATRVSILMPVLNGARALPALLAQVLRQRAPAQLDIIAIDSGSTDDTVAVLTDFGATVLALAPGAFNHGTTRNLLAAHATGELLVFLNQTAQPANDYWLAHLIEPLQRNPLLAAVSSRVIPWPDADYLVYREVTEGPSGSPDRVVRSVRDWAEFHALHPHEQRLRVNFHTASAAIRPELLARFPFRQVRVMGEDVQWAKDVLLAGYHIQHEPASLVYHSHHYSLAELFQRNVDDGGANRDILDRQIDAADVLPQALLGAQRDSRYLSENFGLAGEALLEQQLEAMLRHVLQAAGQWVGSHPERLDPALLPALSRVAAMQRAATAPVPSPQAARALPLPPPELRFRVTGSLEAAGFEEGGRLTLEDFSAGLARHGAALAGFQSVYDFGCGCGRLLRHLVAQLPPERLTASDIDQPAVRWVQTHLPLVDARVTEHLPPLPFADGAFDLVLGYSIFTHLDERYQDAWLAELRRVSAPGAWLLLTVHGQAAWQAGLPTVGPAAADLDRQRQQHGFVYWRGEGWDPHFPDFYHTSWHTPAYVRRHWSQWFTVVDVLEHHMRPTHDLVLLRRP